MGEMNEAYIKDLIDALNDMKLSASQALAMVQNGHSFADLKADWVQRYCKANARAEELIDGYEGAKS